MKRLPFERLCNSHQKRGSCFFFFESKKKMRCALASAHENNKGKKEFFHVYPCARVYACVCVCQVQSWSAAER